MNRKNFIPRIVVGLVALCLFSSLSMAQATASKSAPKSRQLKRRLPICSTSTPLPRISSTPFLGSEPRIPKRSSTAVPTRLRRILYARRSFPRQRTIRSKIRSLPNKSSVRGLEHR